MSQIYSKFLQDTLLKQKKSIQSYTIEDKKVWLKKATSRHSTLIYLPLTWFAKLFNLSMFRPVPNHGGEKTIICEVTRIQQLSRVGINVPTILAYSPNGILLEDNAKNNVPVHQLQSALSKEHSIESRLSLYQEAIQHIQHIHNLNCYLSEAFARNILVDEYRNFSFIDFETDPGQILTLEECYIRDWLCLIFSTASCFEEKDLPQVAELFKINFKNNQKSYDSICKIGQKIKWIRHLKLDKLGSDGRRLQKCILLLLLLH